MKNENQPEKEKETDLHFATKWMEDMAESANEMYKKQVDMGFDIYNNFFNLSNQKKTPGVENFLGFNIFKNAAQIFKKNIEAYLDMARKMRTVGLQSSPSSSKEEPSENISKQINEMYNKQTNQYKEFNKQFLELIRQNFKGTTLDSSLYTNKLKQQIDELFDSSLESTRYLLKSYEETSDFSIAENKRLIDEISKQLDMAAKANLDFWSDTFKSINRPDRENHRENHSPRKMSREKAPVHANHTGRRKRSMVK